MTLQVASSHRPTLDDLTSTSQKIAFALTLNETTNWPTAKELKRLGETRAGGTPAKVRQILERIGEAIQQTAKDVRAYIVEHPEFAEVGQRMLQEWETGLCTSLLGR